MRRPAPGKVGAMPDPSSIGPLTQTDIVRFAGAGGDFNPLHHDPDYAAAAGFERPIAMGQLTAGLLAAWLTDWCGVENLRRYDVRFVAPLLIGDTVRLAGEVVGVEPLSAGLGLAALELTASRGDDTLASGHATVVVTV
jgi:3-hydroxybutyryl-CoA dehydratase